MFDFSAILPSLPFLLSGIPLTLAMAAAALLIGILAALPMALIRAADIPGAAVVVRWTIEFFRTTPPPAYHLDLLCTAADVRYPHFGGDGGDRRAGGEHGGATR